MSNTKPVRSFTDTENALNAAPEIAMLAKFLLARTETVARIDTLLSEWSAGGSAPVVKDLGDVDEAVAIVGSQAIEEILQKDVKSPIFEAILRVLPSDEKLADSPKNWRNRLVASLVVAAAVAQEIASADLTPQTTREVREIATRDAVTMARDERISAFSNLNGLPKLSEIEAANLLAVIDQYVPEGLGQAPAALGDFSPR